MKDIQIPELGDIEAAVAPVRSDVEVHGGRIDGLAQDATLTGSRIADLVRSVGPLQSQVAAIKPGAGVPMPGGVRPKWVQVFAEDFLTDCPEGGFRAVYGQKIGTYPETYQDTSKRGRYTDRYLSVTGSVATARLLVDGGQPWSCAIKPMSPADPTKSLSSAGMRVSQCVRIRLDDGWKVAHLLWPTSENYLADGEIDFPEFEGSNNVSGFVHYTGATVQTDQSQVATKVDPTEWHVLTTEWFPGVSVRFLCDGIELGKVTARVPTKPMRWTGQCETSMNVAAPIRPAAVGTVEWDWITVHVPA